MIRKKIAGIVVRCDPYDSKLDKVSISDRAKIYFGGNSGTIADALYVENYLILKKFTDMQEEELREQAWRLAGGDDAFRPDKSPDPEIDKGLTKLKTRFIKFVLYNEDKDWVPMRECIVLETGYVKASYSEYFDHHILENNIKHRVSSKKYKHSFWVEVNKKDYISYVVEKYKISLPKIDI